MQHNKQTDKPKGPVFGVGDEVAYALGKGLRYGSVIRLIGSGESAQVEIQFEDGGREVHKMRDRALSLLRRASGASAHDEAREQRDRLRDYGIDEVRRSDQRRR